jgi:hypothetical protein
MSEIVLARILSKTLASAAMSSRWAKESGHGLQDKSADCGRAHVIGRIGVFDHFAISSAVARQQFASKFNMRSARAAGIRKIPQHGRA